MMRVAFIHTDLRIYWPARLKALNKFLHNKNIQLEVIEISGAGSPYAFAGKAEHDGLSWHILFPEQRMEEIKNSDIKRRLYDLLNKIKPDILISGAIAFPSGALSVAWAYKHKKHVICFDDAKIDAVQRSGIVNKIKQYIYNGVSAMLYPSEDWNATGDFWGFSKDQIFYGVDVVDNSFWQDYNQNACTIQPYFLAVGRQIPKKNFLHIVKSYHNYYKRYRAASIPLVVVGDGPEHPDIEEYIKSHNLTSFVTLEPFKTQNELKDIYHHASCLILSSSSSETWGLVINEAMACGTPVIASDQCGATHTLIKDGYNGFSFILSKQDALYERMCEYHELPQSVKDTMRQNAVNTMNNWGLPLFCKNCHEAILYVSLLKPKRLSFINSLIINTWKGRYRPI